MSTRLRTAAAGIALALASTLGVTAAAPASAIEPVGFAKVSSCADPQLNAFDNWSGHTLGAYKDTNWVPQGMTYDATGDYLYVSMYHRDALEVPRVVVYKRSTSAWVKTIELSGVPKKATPVASRSDAATSTSPTARAARTSTGSRSSGSGPFPQARVVPSATRRATH